MAQGVKLTDQEIKHYLKFLEGRTQPEAAAKAGVSLQFMKRIVRGAKALGLDIPRKAHAPKEIAAAYDLNGSAELTPEEAWNTHDEVFRREAIKALDRKGYKIKRGRGPVVIVHFTDTHIDDDKTPLRILEREIQRAHDLDAVRCHGGDALNNWPMAGRLAQEWARQECTMHTALLRLQHYITILEPEAWVDGNHEEMNPYLEQIIRDRLPKECLQDYWTIDFDIVPKNGRVIACRMSHKFQTGSSWFHKTHGHIRQALEEAPVDLLMDGHLHSYGAALHHIPGRQQTTCMIASAGFKELDNYAARISKGGKVLGRYGRTNWIVADTEADEHEQFLTPFTSADQAEAYLNGLQNLRAA